MELGLNNKLLIQAKPDLLESDVLVRIEMYISYFKVELLACVHNVCGWPTLSVNSQCTWTEPLVLLYIQLWWHRFPRFGILFYTDVTKLVRVFKPFTFVLHSCDGKLPGVRYHLKSNLAEFMVWGFTNWAGMESRGGWKMWMVGAGMFQWLLNQAHCSLRAQNEP